MATPFGIRRRIKRLLGLGPKKQAVSDSTETITLTVVTSSGEEQTVTAPAGSTVLASSGGLARPIASGCVQGECGTCRVEVLEGAENLSEQTARERTTLQSNKYPMTWRLACKTFVEKGAVKVRAFELA